MILAGYSSTLCFWNYVLDIQNIGTYDAFASMTFRGTVTEGKRFQTRTTL